MHIEGVNTFHKKVFTPLKGLLYCHNFTIVINYSNELNQLTRSINA